MEISLIRHGKSTLTDNRRITCKEFNSWVESYDENGVVEENFYPSETLQKIKAANVVITSDLKRAIESAKLLHQPAKIVSLPLFREAELPYIPIKGVKLSPNSWAVLLRCLWFLGYSNGCESFVQAKQRAQAAAQLLVQHVHEHKTIALVGHGFFNRLLAKELQQMGWTGKKKTDSSHWKCTTYYFHPIN